MAKQSAAESAPRSDEMVAIMSEIAAKSRALVEDFLSRQNLLEAQNAVVNPNAIGSAFLELTRQLMSNPFELAQAQFELWQDYLRLWQTTTQRLMGQEVEPVIVPERTDRRFKDPAWSDNVLFDFIKQS